VPNKGDNAWLIVSAVLVIMMAIPGLALFYGGLVRAKNMLSVLLQVFAVFSLISVLWVVYGYSIAFTEGSAFFGSLDKVLLKGITPDSVVATWTKGVVISEFIYVAFQGAFAAITVALILGAFAERIKFSAVLLFSVLWFTFSYLPMAHMVWYWAGPDAYTSAEAADAATATAASCSRRAPSTSPAAPWCTSTPPLPAWSVPSWLASGSVTAANPSLRTA
jgi:Amt family ammonium transporter